MSEGKGSREAGCEAKGTSRTQLAPLGPWGGSPRRRPGGAASEGGEDGRDIMPGPPSLRPVGGASARRAGAGSRRGKRRSRPESVPVRTKEKRRPRRQRRRAGEWGMVGKEGAREWLGFAWAPRCPRLALRPASSPAPSASLLRSAPDAGRRHGLEGARKQK